MIIPPLTLGQDSLTLLKELLQQKASHDIMPILRKEADKSSGEIFPTVWYSSDAEATAMQFFDFAQAVLIAEAPQLKCVLTLLRITFTALD